MNSEKVLNESKILYLLRDLDKRLDQPCSIVICGGAAAIVAHGLKRFTGDIDIFEPNPKSKSFYNSVNDLIKSNGLDPSAINDGAKGFVDYLSPNYRQRLIPLNADFNNLKVSFISKPDFLTMKICAWRDTDIRDVVSLGISKDDLTIINENLAHLAHHSPDHAHKAHLVLAEIGAQALPEIKADEVNSLAELVQFYFEKTGTDATFDEIKAWERDMSLGLDPSFLASLINKENSPSKDMDLSI
jgi:hypothetical protein